MSSFLSKEFRDTVDAWTPEQRAASDARCAILNAELEARENDDRCSEY